MPVKDIVGLYESRVASSRSGARRGSHHVDGLPPPSISRTGYAPLDYAPSDQSSNFAPSDTLYDDLTTDTHDAHHELTKDIADEFHDLSKSRARKLGSMSKTRGSAFEDDAIEMKNLLSRADTQYTFGKRTLQSVPESSSTLHLDSEPKLPSHNPIPATTVFARNAPPLSFPQLDAHLAAISPPTFHREAGKDGKLAMFPPLQLLAASKRTLEDLEKNNQIPSWYENRNKIFGVLASLALSITGASALVSFYSLRGLIDTLQIFALILNTIAHGIQTDVWRKVILGTIPNVLALNFATSTKWAMVILIVLMTVAGILLYFFYRATSLCCQLGTVEGLQAPNFFPHTWLLVLMSFVLTALYLPLSTMAMHVVVWSDDLWVVPNPYTNATTFPPVLPPLGPAAEYRDPLDFCWTTTMKKNELNYAPVLVILALICLGGFTVWYPIHLYRVINLVYPKVDPYTELGTKRSNSDMDREYQRLLDRDKNPLQFLYRDYRRGWATYEALYLIAKLTALLIVAFIDPDNCLFRSLNRSHVTIARQSILLVAMTGFFVRQCILVPFLDPVSNASEWMSRLNYVLTATIALCVALNVPGKGVLDGPILYIVYAVTYGMSVYFTVINWSFMQRFVKRISGRIDFSIDIFSPRIDLSASSPHTKRRIWQEAISVLFLTSPECGIPKTQPMEFAQARNSEYPPYLLNFAGTPGERHVENLKVLREVGMASYTQGVVMLAGARSPEFRELLETIQRHFVGPDCYWKDPHEHTLPPRCRRHFGNAWFVPFPPTVVIRYDDGPLVALREVAELELYVRQNSSHDIQRRREVRMALRALDGLVVAWPYEYTQPVGARRPLCCCCAGRRYRARVSIRYRAAVFRLVRQGSLMFGGVDLGSGFRVELQYAKGVVADGAAIGLGDDCELTPPLARFLALNEELVTESLARLETVLARYRHSLRKDARAKAEALSYRFLSAVYDRPQGPAGLSDSAIEFERDPRVRRLILENDDVFQVSYERLQAVSRSELTAWWYIFWDDLWRRNHDTISKLRTYATDFDPHYPTSIAYTPLPRAALESFLAQRGLLRQKAAWNDFFDSGFLNKIYMRMNDILFHGNKQADIIHLGPAPSELDMEEVDAKTQARPSTLGTGGGTDHDDQSIRARPLYRWEGILEDPLRKAKQQHPNWLAKFGVWLGVTPLWRAGIPSMGLALDVKLDHGQYVLLQDANEGSVFEKR